MDKILWLLEMIKKSLSMILTEMSSKDSIIAIKIRLKILLLHPLILQEIQWLLEILIDSMSTALIQKEVNGNKIHASILKIIIQLIQFVGKMMEAN